MLDNIEKLLGQVNLLECRFGLIEFHQTQAVDFFSRKFMDNCLVDFVSFEYRPTVFGVAVLTADAAFSLFLSVRLWIDNVR